MFRTQCFRGRSPPDRPDWGFDGRPPGDEHKRVDAVYRHWRDGRVRRDYYLVGCARSRWGCAGTTTMTNLSSRGTRSIGSPRDSQLARSSRISVSVPSGTVNKS